MSELRAEVSHTYSDWYDKIMAYERSFKLWEARVDKILKKYKDAVSYTHLTLPTKRIV